MFKYVTGDLLKSEASCLVNTVNCEGVMGKGLAYQFKEIYPEMNKDYSKACEDKTLIIGKLHYYEEKNKLIINFPTKDKWREKSKIEYIEKGLDELIILIKKLNVDSISIPPLGSGNGGLDWIVVRGLIEKKLKELSNQIDIYIYEPSKNFNFKNKNIQKLSLSALILMQIKLHITVFDRFHLQQTAYLINVFSKKECFSFSMGKNGPYDSSIDHTCRDIKKFQMFYNVEDTKEAYDIANKMIISKSINSRLNYYIPFIEQATQYVNSISNDFELECIMIILFIIQKNNNISEENIKNKIKDISSKFLDSDISKNLKKLKDNCIVEKTLLGYCIR